MPLLMPEERLGQRLAERYRLEAVLSIGGMGVLFSALDEATGAPVAVKMLKTDSPLDPSRVARFRRETQILSALRHPNIARLLDVQPDAAGVPFFVMELLCGRSLRDDLDERGTLSLAETLTIVLPIAHALSSAHATGVVHRDVTPSNIFLSLETGIVVPKLLDFGIAKGRDDTFDTQTGHIVGTPGYMSPEQARFGECGPAADVWGVGAVVYRCLAGHPPHAGGSVPELMSRLLRDPVAPLAAEGLPKSVGATVDRALAREPHRRYPTMDAFIRALVTATGAAGDEVTADATSDVAQRVGASASAGRVRYRGPARTARPWRALAVPSVALAVVIPIVLAGREHTPEALTARSTQKQAAAAIEAPPARPSAARALPAAPDNSTAIEGNAGGDPAPVVARRAAPRGLPTPRHGAAAPISTARADWATIEREPTTGLPVVTEW